MVGLSEKFLGFGVTIANLLVMLSITLHTMSQKNQVKQVAMPKPKNPDYIDWRKSQAKKVIITDLEDGVLPADETPVSSEQAWDMYKNLPAFKDRCLLQAVQGVLGRSPQGI